MRLIGFCGVYSEAAICAGIEGQRHPLLAFPLHCGWFLVWTDRHGPALRYPGFTRSGFSVQQSIEGNRFLRH